MGNLEAFFPSSGEISGSSAVRVRRKPNESSNLVVYNCDTCGIYKFCRHPRIQRFGKGRKKILFVGLCPGWDEDKVGVPFVGRSGDLLRKHCRLVGIDLDEDAIRTNIVACYKNTNPTKEQILACHSNLLRDIQEVQPELIICLGDEAINAILEKPKGCDSLSKFSAGLMHGRVVPSHKFNCWVAGSYHPAFYLRRKDRDDVPNDENILAFDIAKAVSYLDKPLPKHLTEEGNYLVETAEEAVSVLKEYTDYPNPVSYDYETTTLRPWEDGAQILAMSVSPNVQEGYFFPFELINPKTGLRFFSRSELETIYCALRNFLKSSTPKMVQNINMEEIWNREIVGQRMNNFLYDTMLGAHVLNCNTLTTSLAFQVFELTGHDYKAMVGAQNMAKVPVDKMKDYNCWDSRYLHLAYQHQISRMRGEGGLLEFNAFLQRGSLALVSLYQRGVPVDPKVLTDLEEQFFAEQVKCTQEIRFCKGVQEYEALKKGRFNPKSSAQIGKVLYSIYKIPVKKYTSKEKTRGSTDIDVLEEVLKNSTEPDVKNFVTFLIRLKQCKKILERVANYRRLLDKNNRVHPCYNMHIADTYRSSANDPSIQNVFKHDKELIVFRKCIVPSAPDRIILEVDRSGIEVCQIAMSSRDSELIRQISEGVDTHRKWAGEIFQKPENQVTYDERYESKNGFVFRSFFGGKATSMPAYSDRFGAIPVEHFIKVQKKFWQEFKGVKEWQNKTIQDYCDLGYVEAVSGFRRYGPLNVNKIYNTPIQGPAFHLTLMDIIKIELEGALVKKGFKSNILFEVHDSLTMDVVIEEAEDLVATVTGIMVGSHFDWQCVPLRVEWQVGVLNWYDLSELIFQDCGTCGRQPHSRRVDKEKQIETLQCAKCKNISQHVLGRV